MEQASKLWSIVNRKKTLAADMMETPLSRCLSTFDLTLLGIGHMVGAGIYVITGTVVRDLAGPAAMLSYLLAGAAAILASLCYAEFGARVPKAGSAYSYTYVSIGEFWAFIIGWNIVLEHLIGVSSVARAWSGIVDTIFNGAIKNGTMEYIGTMAKDSKWISDYPDFLSVIVVFIFMGFIISGAKISLRINNIFTLLNAIVIVVVIGGGLYFADKDNWTNQNRGGFLPYGFQGVFTGAAACFYAYIGFEGIATAGEEARNPERSIPIATIASMSIVTVTYLLVSTSLTLMVPYYDVDTAAPYPTAFAEVGANWLKYIVAVGSLFGITTSLLGTLFSLPRAVYAMAADGVLFKVFARVNAKTQTPIIAIVVCSAFSAVMAFLFEISTLVEIMSIGTLMAYTLVAASIIILRYIPIAKCQFKLKPESEKGDAGETDEGGIIPKSKSHEDFGRLKEKFARIPILRNIEPGDAAIWATLAMLGLMAATCLLCFQGSEYILDASWWAIILLVLFLVGIILCFLVIVFHEQNDAFLTFQIPFVPLIPALSMFCNVALMIKLSYLTWIRLAIWLAIGILIYFGYGIRHSLENKPLSTYNQLVSYIGDSASKESGLNKFSEDVCHQQPRPQGHADDVYPRPTDESGYDQ